MTSIISAKNVRVVFPLFDNVSRSVKARMLTKKVAINNRQFVGLDNITLDINDGDRIGLLGTNGAGKSTLLKTLAGVYQPVSGELVVNGTITSLFDVGVGIDADASGYDNIPLLMATRGIPLNRLNDIVEDVEKFTELGEALMRPVRTYSSGMKLRLAFAVATAKSSEILLMDEVVGVGDANFRDKSRKRVEEMMMGAGTLLLASHSKAFLTTYCTRGLVFKSGKVIYDGSIADAIKFHENV